MKEELPISDDIVTVFEEYTAAIRLRDIAIKLPFGYQKAFSASKDAERLRSKAWRMVANVYPETKHSPCEFNAIRRVIIIDKE